jgi:rhodanese-related sulfurtransferase
MTRGTRDERARIIDDERAAGHGRPAPGHSAQHAAAPDADEARAALARGAVLVDIRSDRQRDRDGIVPGARYVPRNVLEWRCDPASEARDPATSQPGQLLMLMCDEGYQSSLAAATLQRFGLTRATDVIGGFQAWRDAGLPVVVRQAIS